YSLGLEDCLTGSYICLYCTANIVPHPRYGEVVLDNDIALIKLSSPVVFNQSYIAPVCLPALGQKFDNGTAIVTGWGSIEYYGANSDKLRMVELPLVPHEICSKTYSPYVTENMICADVLLLLS
ncbi:vitamin K-dependent protein C-like, partial [Penaeus monodon]|uniref:vitamin K-dependent protein C-like n=1 Tax=Penaeus monodon TaxID=6687 RepID=UPI0018A743D1